jgi:hypothetical protein
MGELTFSSLIMPSVAHTQNPVALSCVVFSRNFKMADEDLIDYDEEEETTTGVAEGASKK